MSDQPLQIGSSVVPLYVERKMKVYAITESEFNSVSMFNTQTTICCSIGLAMLSAAVSIWVNAIFYVEVTPAAFVAQKYVAPVGVLLTFVSFWLAWKAAKNRQSTWAQIKEESALLATPRNASPSA